MKQKNKMKLVKIQQKNIQCQKEKLKKLKIKQKKKCKNNQKLIMKLKSLKNK